MGQFKTRARSVSAVLLQRSFTWVQPCGRFYPPAPMPTVFGRRKPSLVNSTCQPVLFEAYMAIPDVRSSWAGRCCAALKRPLRKQTAALPRLSAPSSMRRAATWHETHLSAVLSHGLLGASMSQWGYPRLHQRWGTHGITEATWNSIF